MTTTALKTDIRKRLNSLEDERILKAIYAILKETAEPEIFGYTANGKAITLKDLQKQLAIAEEDIKSGKTYTTEQARKHLKNKFK